MMTSILVGCGNKEGSKNEDASSNSVQSSSNDAEKNSGGDIKVNMGNSGVNLSLPDGFPKDVVPLLGDANVINVIDNKESKAMGITYTTDKSFEDAVAFYQEVIKDGVERSESASENGYLMFANKAGIDISAVISKYEGEKVSVFLNVSTADQETSGSSTTSGNTFEDAETVDVPRNYPMDKLPIISGDKITEASVTEDDSTNSYYLIVLSTKKIEEIMDYYDSKWGSITNKYKTISSKDFDLQGEIEKYRITIRGEVQDDQLQLIEYYILIDESKQ
jgi:predicted enzyme related to lactoylglutathione lyase